MHYAKPLLEAMIYILNCKKTQFVGTKTLNAAMRFFLSALARKNLREVCMPMIHKVLFELTMPMLLLSQTEYEAWNDNQIEYVRMQVDHLNPWSVKRNNQDMIRGICGIRATRRNKISEYLTQYLDFIV